MLINTKGIILHSTKYSDTSLVVKIYTEARGTQSFIVKGVFGKKGKLRPALFASLALVNLTFDDNPRHNLKYIREMSLQHTPSDLSFDPVRSSILMFYNELLYKLLPEAGEDVVLFHFLEQEIPDVAGVGELFPDRPLRFMIRLSVVLGFFPENNYSERECHFSLAEGRFQSYYVDERNDLPEDESRYLSQLICDDGLVRADRTLRNSLLRYLIQYYIIHNEQTRTIESVDVLAAVLH